MTENFTSIPILDYLSSQSPTTKPKFLSDLRSALVEVGFFQIINSPLPLQLQQNALRLSAQFFKLSTDEKLQIENIHSRHFLGYSKINSESTAARTDHNESILVWLPSFNLNVKISDMLLANSRWALIFQPWGQINRSTSMSRDQTRYEEMTLRTDEGNY